MARANQHRGGADALSKLNVSSAVADHETRGRNYPNVLYSLVDEASGWFTACALSCRRMWAKIYAVQNDTLSVEKSNYPFMHAVYRLFREISPAYPRLIRDDHEPNTRPRESTKTPSNPFYKFYLIGFGEIVAFHYQRPVAVKEYRSASGHEKPLRSLQRT
jgi:hypothetical protein